LAAAALTAEEASNTSEVAGDAPPHAHNTIAIVSAADTAPVARLTPIQCSRLARSPLFATRIVIDPTATVARIVIEPPVT
jgi:hypothetical protein